MWLINQLQLAIERTHHLVPDAPMMTGWVNGDLYQSAGKRVGILPLPDKIRAESDIESHIVEKDITNLHAYMAYQQGTKYAVISIHTPAEKTLFKKMMQEYAGFNRTNTAPDWKGGAREWNCKANGKDIFYKVSLFLNHIYVVLTPCSCLSICRLISTNGTGISMRRIPLHKCLQKLRHLRGKTGILKDQ